MGVPPEMEVRFHSAAEAAPLLDVYRTEPQPGILLTGDIATMRELVLPRRRARGEHRRHPPSGRAPAVSALRLPHAATEQRALRDVAALGALVTAQDVPAARADPARGDARQRRGTSMRELLPLRMLGGLLGLDVVCFPQMMISRPLVGATLAGAFVGDTTTGLLVGVTLELIALATLPFGASRYPEWGSAGVVGGAIAAALHTQPRRARSPSACWRRSPRRGSAAGRSSSCASGTPGSARRKRAGARGGRARHGDRAPARRSHLRSRCARWRSPPSPTRLLFPVAHAAVALWSFSEHLSRAVTVGAASAVAAAAAWTIFHSARGARWYFAGRLGDRAPHPRAAMTAPPRAAARRRPDAARLGVHVASACSCARSPSRARGTTRRCSATASASRSSRCSDVCPVGSTPTRSRRRWRARARTSTRIRISRPSPSARWPAPSSVASPPSASSASARRSAAARQRRRSARVGGMASPLVARRARRLRARCAAADVVLIFVADVQRRALGLRIWGLYVGWTRGLAVASALAQSRAPRTGRRTSPAPPPRSPASPSRSPPRASSGSDGLLLEARSSRGADRRRLVRVHGRVEGWKLVARAHRCSSPSSR